MQRGLEAVGIRRPEPAYLLFIISIDFSVVIVPCSVYYSIITCQTSSGQIIDKVFVAVESGPNSACLVGQLCYYLLQWLVLVPLCNVL